MKARRLGRSLVGLACAALLGLFSMSGCAGEPDALILVGGEKIDASLIDRDPAALLPADPVVFGVVDAKTLFATSLGPSVVELVTAIVPLGAEAHFQPARDVTKVWGGAYALQGANFCAVVQGDFDVDAIKKTAASHGVSALGAPLVASRYAEVDVYTAGNVGFAIVTSHTLLAGDETGMRRALDRLRRGKLERSVPDWMMDLAKTPDASLVVAADLKGQPAVASAARFVPFLMGLERARVLGNFRAPGLNLAGALTYPDEQAATSAAAALKGANVLAPIVTILLGHTLGGAFPKIDFAQAKHDVAFTTEVDAALLRNLGHAATTAARTTIVAH